MFVWWRVGINISHFNTGPVTQTKWTAKFRITDNKREECTFYHVSSGINWLLKHFTGSVKQRQWTTKFRIANSKRKESKLV